MFPYLEYFTCRRHESVSNTIYTWHFKGLQHELSPDQLCCSFWLIGRSNNSLGVFSPIPASYHGSQEPPCSATVPSYGGHQSERLLPGKLGKANCSLISLFWFPLFSNFANTAHQDVHHARRWGPFLMTILWHSWGHASLGLHCRFPGLSFHGPTISCILNALHWLLFLPFSQVIHHKYYTYICSEFHDWLFHYKSHPAVSCCHFQLNYLDFF